MLDILITVLLLYLGTTLHNGGTSRNGQPMIKHLSKLRLLDLSDWLANQSSLSEPAAMF